MGINELVEGRNDERLLHSDGARRLLPGESENE